MADRILKTEELLKEFDKYTFKQLHIHHTWKPTHKDFNGKNHLQLQESMRRYHVNHNGWNDIGQHITLMPDGKWVTGRPFNQTPASIKGWNTGALAVEMLGNFDKPGTGTYNSSGYDTLKGAQKESILALIKYFGDRFGYSRVKFHREGPGVAKTCPGTSLDKATLIEEAKKYSTKPESKTQPSGILYRVQTGAFKIKSNAEALLEKVKKAGFDTYMVYHNGLYKVQVGAYAIRENAENMAKKLKAKGFDVYITIEAGQPVSSSKTSTSTKTIKVGSKVKVRKGARSYEGKKVADFVYNRVYTVDQLKGDRAVLDLKGICTAFKVSDLILQ